MLKNKMSLTMFKEWTLGLQERMHTELSVLCDKNISLQVDNQVLLQRIEPLVALEKSVLQEQEGGDIQGMLVSESDVEVMKQSMLQIGGQMWKEIRDRVEAWVSKPYYSLQGAFVSRHEDMLIAEVDRLESENVDLREQLSSFEAASIAKGKSVVVEDLSLQTEAGQQEDIKDGAPAQRVEDIDEEEDEPDKDSFLFCKVGTGTLAALQALYNKDSITDDQEQQGTEEPEVQKPAVPSGGDLDRSEAASDQNKEGVTSDLRVGVVVFGISILGCFVLGGRYGEEAFQF